MKELKKARIRSVGVLWARSLFLPMILPMYSYIFLTYRIIFILFIHLNDWMVFYQMVYLTKMHKLFFLNRNLSFICRNVVLEASCRDTVSNEMTRAKIKEVGS